MEILSDAELRRWMGAQRWIYARTMPKHPHEYTLRIDQDREQFGRAVATIWREGYDRRYLRRSWRSIDVDGYVLWVHTRPTQDAPPPLEQTILINRAKCVQERLF